MIDDIFLLPLEELIRLAALDSLHDIRDFNKEVLILQT
jgi:hypothetical protein